MSSPDSLGGLYIDPESGKKISTHSMLKTFRRCPKQAEYKYFHRLKPRVIGTPLKRGVWVHELLEIHHNGEDWRPHHQKLSKKFNDLFDEEKDFYGDLPTEIAAVMESYTWHYKNDPWKVIATEKTLEAELPDGTIYRGKVDAIIENAFGTFLVDHKTHKTLPDHTFRLLDAQSALYLWAAAENGIEVQGFIWNYVRWKAPSVPELLKDGTRISKRACDTDYPTMYKALRRYKDENPQFKISEEDRSRLRYLQGLRYNPNGPQESSFFRRQVMEKDPEMLRRVLTENFHTSLRMHDYNFTNPDAVERVVDRGCTFGCSYVDLCTAELLTGDTRIIRKQKYIEGDPNDYYNDQKDEKEK